MARPGIDPIIVTQVRVPVYSFDIRHKHHVVISVPTIPSMKRTGDREIWLCCRSTMHERKRA